MWCVPTSSSLAQSKHTLRGLLLPFLGIGQSSAGICTPLPSMLPRGEGPGPTAMSGINIWYIIRFVELIENPFRLNPDGDGS
jgi:hypothetical protein